MAQLLELREAQRSVCQKWQCGQRGFNGPLKSLSGLLLSTHPGYPAIRQCSGLPYRGIGVCGHLFADACPFGRFGKIGVAHFVEHDGGDVMVCVL